MRYEFCLGGWPTFTFCVKVGTSRSVATVFLDRSQSMGRVEVKIPTQAA